MTLELTRAGELKALDGTLANTLRHELNVAKDFPVFVPYSSYLKHPKSAKSVSVLVEGYAFVSTGLSETKYFALENKPHVAQVLSSRARQGMRVLHTIPNYRVVEMQRKLRELVSSDVAEGMTVRVTGGCYSRLEGLVIDVYPESVALRIPLRSIDILAIVSKSNISLDLDEDPLDMGSGEDTEFEPYEAHMETLEGI